MDVVTHGMMGLIGGSAIAREYPEAAAAFALGSVLPDLDALSRAFGKRAFLAAHQTWSHALPVIGALGLLAWGLREAAGVYAPWAPGALVAGMSLHALTDWTNTYGITLLLPFSRRRWCREWVFFIDAFVVAACVLALAALGLGLNGARGVEVQALWALALLAYWPAKVALRARARRFAPERTTSLLPSALVPWHFLGCARDGEQVRTFRVDAVTGRVDGERRHAVLDGRFAAALARGVPEFDVMRALSPAYHVVEAVAQGAEATLVRCRDLRTRNFGTRFGELDVLLGPADRVHSVTFHV